MKFSKFNVKILNSDKNWDETAKNDQRSNRSMTVLSDDKVELIILNGKYWSFKNIRMLVELKVLNA